MPTVLIIDDHVSNRNILADIIQSIEDHLTVECFQDPMEALGWLHWHTPDLVLADHELPNMSGVEFIRQARTLNSCKGVPILLVSPSGSRNTLHAGLEAGATDFISRPIDDFECHARCRNLLTQRWQHKVIHDRAKWLERQVAEATTEIRIREHETLLRLARAGEYRDEETGNHVIRMAKYSRIIAEQLGRPKEECEVIELAAPMHDIGKIGIPDHILRKPGKLSPAEFDVMKRHAKMGYEILKDSPSQYLQLGAVIAYAHHEKYDGSGYPRGLRGTEIPLAARIVALADAYDALTSERPYKRAWSVDEALDYIDQHRGTHFDPECIDAFRERLDKVLKIQYLLGDHQARKVRREQEQAFANLQSGAYPQLG